MKKIIGLILTTIMLICPNVSEAISIEYTNMDVPTYINSSFKTWMDYRLCAWGSPQRNFSEKWGWMDSEGFMRCNGERDFGVDQDYYLVAMGSYYGRTIGTKYRVTTDTGNTFYVVLAEYKADRHTNYTNQYCPGNNDILEFLIHPTYLNPLVKDSGSANVYMPLNGSVTKIEKMTFIWD